MFDGGERHGPDAIAHHRRASTCTSLPPMVSWVSGAFRSSPSCLVLMIDGGERRGPGAHAHGRLVFYVQPIVSRVPGPMRSSLKCLTSGRTLRQLADEGTQLFSRVCSLHQCFQHQPDLTHLEARHAVNNQVADIAKVYDVKEEGFTMVQLNGGDALSATDAWTKIKTADLDFDTSLVDTYRDVTENQVRLESTSGFDHQLHSLVT